MKHVGNIDGAALGQPLVCAAALSDAVAACKLGKSAFVDMQQDLQGAPSSDRKLLELLRLRIKVADLAMQRFNAVAEEVLDMPLVLTAAGDVATRVAAIELVVAVREALGTRSWMGGTLAADTMRACLVAEAALDSAITHLAGERPKN